jgi:hypothetical protein
LPDFAALIVFLTEIGWLDDPVNREGLELFSKYMDARENNRHGDYIGALLDLSSWWYTKYLPKAQLEENKEPVDPEFREKISKTVEKIIREWLTRTRTRSTPSA